MSSFMRRLSHPFANWDTQRENLRWGSDELHPKVKDEVFQWKVGSRDFECLDAESLIRADIVANHTRAKTVLKAAHKIGTIDAETGHPVTTKIDRSMLSEMPILSIVKQRDLIKLLFFWEEECTRWRLLGEEEKELGEKLREEGLSREVEAELKTMLMFVRERKRVLPSVRDESGHVRRQEDEQLPTYDEARRQR
ncbi:Hypothetical predicted protein [Lecanosticta acicola]|uniref:Uncharacterized protein n=1 Tax=Lecanosticta acicola TaxID=111012 RepID=A0AAI8Z5L6_9PEZI|nr:Hypothetical predicted protein [Lecanosticta acicola]